MFIKNLNSKCLKKNWNLISQNTASFDRRNFRRRNVDVFVIVESETFPLFVEIGSRPQFFVDIFESRRRDICLIQRSKVDDGGRSFGHFPSRNRFEIRTIFQQRGGIVIFDRKISFRIVEFLFLSNRRFHLIFWQRKFDSFSGWCGGFFSIHFSLGRSFFDNFFRRILKIVKGKKLQTIMYFPFLSCIIKEHFKRVLTTWIKVFEKLNFGMEFQNIIE